MKKTMFFILMILSLIILYGCQETTDQNIPVFSGVEDLTLALGDVFDATLGVTAQDIDGNDLTEDMIVSGVEAMFLDNGKVANTGVFTITYTVTDALGRTASVQREITVTVPNDNIDPGLYGCDQITLGDYELSWCDEFLGTGINLNANGIDLNKWDFQTGTGSQYGLTRWGNNEQQFYREENAYVQDGKLMIEAKLETYGGMNYTSARLWTRPTFSQTYGRFEAMIKLPLGDGLWPAFWMLPTNSPYGTWARSGEIDIMEARGRFPKAASGAIHFGDTWPDNQYTSRTYQFPFDQTINQFHEYAVEWEPGEIRWYVNGNLYYRETDWFAAGHDFPAPFDVDFYMILNLAVGGTFDGNVLPDDSVFDEPVIMEVEYVRVYTKNND